MKLWDKIKNIMVISDEDDYENDAEETTATEKSYEHFHSQVFSFFHAKESAQ